MKKINISVLLVVFLFLLNTDVSAQSFWKKLEKGIQKAGDEINKASKELDKAIGTKEQNNSNSNSASTMVIRPYLTKDTKVIYMDKVDNGFDYADFSSGVSFVKDQKKNRWGVIDTNGNIKIGFIFNSEPTKYGKLPFPRFQSDVCLVSTSIVPYEKAKGLANYAIVIDKNGNVVKEIPGMYSYTNFQDSIAHVKMALVDTKKSTSYRTEYYYKYMYIDTKGNFVYPHLTYERYTKPGEMSTPDVAPIRKIAEGLRAYWSYKTGWGFLDSKGNIVIQPAYRAVHDFKDGYAAVQDWDNNWGFIDRTGKIVIDCKYTNEPSDFYEGLAIVKKRAGGECYIDTDGNIVLDKINNKDVTNLGHFANNKALIYTYDGSAWLDRNLKNYKIIEERVPLGIGGKHIVGYKNGLYLINDGRMMNSKMEIVSYEGHYSAYNSEVRAFNDGLTKFFFSEELNTLTGGNPAYLNENGEVKIIFKEPEF